MSNPKLGQAVRVHYNARVATTMPLHGQLGTVAIVSKGRPRNHGVEVAGQLFIIPAGNLRAYER